MTFEEFVPCGTPFPRSPRNLSANVCCTHGGLVHLSAFLTFFWHVLVRRTSRLSSLDKQETVLCSTLLLFRYIPRGSLGWRRAQKTRLPRGTSGTALAGTNCSDSA